jgi:hypothetical protein
MPVVPLLAGLVAVLAVALVVVVASGRRAMANVPEESAVSALRARVDALRDRYAEIDAHVNTLAIDADLAREADRLNPDVPVPTELVSAVRPMPTTDARYVSTTAPARVPRHPSPPAPSAQVSASSDATGRPAVPPP